MNFFQPSFKLAEKKRIGARVSKRYYAPETPCARLIASDSVPEGMKERLRVVATALDPLRLLDEIRSAQGHLAAVAAGGPLRAAEHRDGDLDAFLKGLSTAWHQGEVRPTHRERPRAKGNGARGRTRSRRCGPACSRGPRRSPIARAPSCSFCLVFSPRIATAR